MERLAKAFAELKRRKEAALVSFITLGYPKPEHSAALALALVRGGSDVLELGIPFSDPVADGPTIQAASHAALEAGMNTDKAFEVIRRVREQTDVPIVILTYYNLLYKRGVERFVADAKEAGADAVLAADLQIDEAHEFEAACRKHGIGAVFVAAPNTPDARAAEIAKRCTGFLYLMALFGVTGARGDVKRETIEATRRVKALSKAPVCVGFGVSKREHVAAIARAGADGVIVGSAYIDEIAKHGAQAEAALERKARELKEGTKIINA